nr:integrase, catalytic region, zinc finger, CCHC-type, peptidase aspartic, catalytic [Tanacetum cinerariifolium]
MLNKKNYVSWSSHLLRYAKSRPNGKLIHNSIINGPYVRRMILEPGDSNREILVNETFHVQTNDELTKKELKQIEADDQAIQTILLGLSEDIYTTVDSCETAQEIWLRVQQMMKGSDIGIQEMKAKLFNEWKRFTSDDGESIESYYHRLLKLMNDLKRNKHFPEKIARILMLHQDQPSFNQNYMQQPMQNPEDITDPITTMNMALALMAKAFKLNYSTPTNNNQRISLNPRNRQIAQPGINMGQDRQMQMVGVQNVGNQVVQNAIQNLRIHNVGNQNGQTVVPRTNQNPNGNGNLVATRSDGNATSIMDAAYLQTQLLIAQKEEVGIQLQAEEFDLMAAAADLNEIEEVNANCILMANLQQASTSGTQTDKAPVYDSDGSAEVHNYKACCDNEIFNMFTQEEQYTELLEPIPESHQSGEELYLSNTSKMATVSKPISLPNEEFSNDTTPSVARKFLNEVKSTIVTLQHVVKHRMTLETHNWSSFTHQELHKIIKDEIFPIVNQVDARVQNFEIQFLKEAAKFVGDFKSLVKEADKSLAKQKALELEIERLLKAVVSQDIVSVIQNNSVGETLNLQTELERTKERFENCIIKKENEYSKLWNDWYKKCEECRFDKISYDKAYNDMQQKIEQLINLFKPSREEKHVPNKVRASVRTTPITVSQPHVFTKKDVNSDSNGLSFTGIDNTKTRRPQPRSNTNNNRVPSASKSSCNKNKGVEVEEHHRNLLLSKNKKHMSSTCNNFKFDSQMLTLELFVLCKQKANVSINEKQKKHQPQVKKTKKVGFIERLYTPKPSKPRSFLRWSPTRRIFDLKGKIIASSKSKSQSNCFKGDNACTSNPMEPTIKRNDHVAAILGFGDLQCGNILITRVYFVERLGYNLFSVGQFCDSDLEVKENSKKDKIGSKSDKNEKHGEAKKSQKQLQYIEEEKLKKM